MRLWLVLVFFFGIFSTECCRDFDSKNAISYQLIKSNSKSTKSVITRRRLVNVAKCKDFAESKQALAFNFDRTAADPWTENCIILRCPETGNISELANATGVDYYSSYPNNTGAGNETLFCIDSVGLFVIFREGQNFTDARAACEKIHGFLADPTSESRSRGLAAIAGDSIMAYVGLSNEGKERLWKNELGDRLPCSEYRAWDSGEPSHVRGCVGVYRLDRKSDPVWKVVACKTKLPYICELPRTFNKTEEQKNNTVNSHYIALLNSNE